MTAPPRVCAACGAPARAPFRVPPAEQAPDLDGRPGEPTRSTLAHWVATCRRCRASAPDLADLPDGSGEVVKSESFRVLQGPAGPFLRWAALCEAAGQRAAAAEAVLQAAWALDDAGEDGTAQRLRAAALWGEPQTTEDALRLLDIQRRAGAFDAALAAAARLERADLDENSSAILAFQRARIADGDRGRHGIGSALRPPARRPHVTHGQAKPGGWWQRLFGA